MSTTTRSMILGATALAVIGAGEARASDWSKMIDVWRVGILGSENEADALKRYQCLADVVEAEFNVPVELYPATDYAGVMQGLIADQLETAWLGPSSYAGVHLQDPKAVEPILAPINPDGSVGYYSVIVTRSQDPYKSIDDLKGASLVWADPNSTSGYLVPRFELKKAGYDPETFFGETGFGGGHEQGVVALLNGQYDAAATWISGTGDPAKGYSRGNLRRMVDKGALDMKDIRVVWQSNMIPGSPIVVRQDLPEQIRQEYKQFLMALPEIDPECAQDMMAGEGQGFAEVSQDDYATIIQMRRDILESRRG